ncbi:hypothetical protein [Desertihabitans aurantiacus]|uniref:hypothetical protein n=1 Tax=Desertihabitans aurantiacus TaxID=2282477 RepID=UPI000DF7E2B5|nr:hypothetical protein [Desertihabitans aurantiacus]
MIGRLFAFLLGTVLGVFVLLKARDLLRRATPEAVQERIGERVGEAQADLGQRVADFTREFTRARDEREAELRDALGMEDSDAAAEAGHVDETVRDQPVGERATEDLARARRAAER